MDLFQYSDYRHWIRDYYSYRKAEDFFFSYRYLAHKINSDASQIARVIQGKGHLAIHSLEALSNLAGFDSTELAFWFALCDFTKAKTPQEQKRHFLMMQELRKPRSAILEKGNEEFFSQWYHVAIKVLAGLADFEGIPSVIAQKLDPAITPHEAEKSLDLLRTLGILQKDTQGKESIRDSFLSSHRCASPVTMREFQRQMMLLAMRSLAEHSPLQRDFSTLTVALSLDDLEEARARMQSLRESLMRLSAESANPNHIYHFNMQLFPLTRVPEGELQGRQKKSRKK